MELLISAIIVILAEAITEGVFLRKRISGWLFDDGIQWITSIILFGAWLIYAVSFDRFYVPMPKIVIGFIFIRFLIFDIVFNLSAGLRWDYYGTTKLYDRIMYELGSFGWMMKFVVLGPVGICFLLGIESMSDIINMFK